MPGQASPFRYNPKPVERADGTIVRRRKFWTEITPKGWCITLAKCPVCGRRFLKKGIVPHFSAQTRKGDEVHATIFVSYYASIGRAATAQEKILKWAERNVEVNRMLARIFARRFF